MRSYHRIAVRRISSPSSLTINLEANNITLNRPLLHASSIDHPFPFNMSLQRLSTPVTSSSLFFKYLATAASRSCPHGTNAPTSRNQHSQSSKRELYTQPAYRPHQMPESMQAPPRNTGIPDTSIAGPNPQLDNSRPPRMTGMQESSIDRQGEEAASISFPEIEAQKSKPVDHTTSAEAAPKPTEKPKRKSKLRPRKAAMSITPSALVHLKELADQPEGKMIRVGVKNRGCSGLAYHLEYVDKPASFDEVVEKDGVKVLIDSKALFSIIGSEMDWQEDKLASRFVFKNPNIKEQCGCGESFMV